MTTEEKGQFIIILYGASLLDFLFNFFNTLYEDYTALQAQSNGGIRVSLLKTI